MGYSVIIHGQAKEDYHRIVDYLLLVSDGPTPAKRFMHEFDKQVALITADPGLYALSRVDALAELGYRSAIVNNYIMLYYTVEDTVHIAHVFHQSQDYARYVI